MQLSPSSDKTSSQNRSRPIRVALVSCGLGNVTRGFEVSTARWDRALRRHTNLDVRLITGGPFENGESVPNIPRENALLAPLLHLPFIPEQNRWELTYGIEQFTFFPGLMWKIAQLKPDVVWVKDVPLAHLVLGARNSMRSNFKIVFANGGLIRPQHYQAFDRIQQLQADAYERAIEFGISKDKMDLLSNCINPDEAMIKPRELVRESLGLKSDDWVVLCTAAWNRYHKRIDYLIEEVARLNDPSVKLVLCGVPEADSDSLRQLGARLLSSRIQWLTLPPEEIPSMICAADSFVLPSLHEGLGNALLEAAIYGTPIVCHPHAGARFILEDETCMADLSQTGSLAQRLHELKTSPPSVEHKQNLAQAVRNRFNDRVLAEQFQNMIERTGRFESA